MTRRSFFATLAAACGWKPIVQMGRPCLTVNRLPAALRRVMAKRFALANQAEDSMRQQAPADLKFLEGDSWERA